MASIHTAAFEGKHSIVKGIVEDEPKAVESKDEVCLIDIGYGLRLDDVYDLIRMRLGRTYSIALGRWARQLDVIRLSHITMQPTFVLSNNHLRILRLHQYRAVIRILLNT
jgi:hypothetical protein